MTTYEKASLSIAAITALVGLVAALFVGVQVRNAVVQARQSSEAQQQEWVVRRKQATIDFLTSTMALNLELAAAFPHSDRMTDVSAGLIVQAESDPVIAQSIRSYLDYLEHIATGVNEGVLDLGVVDRANGGRIIDMASNYASYIDNRRKALGDSRLYTELDQLAAAIRQRRLKPARSNDA